MTRRRLRTTADVNRRRRRRSALGRRDGRARGGRECARGRSRARPSSGAARVPAPLLVDDVRVPRRALAVTVATVSATSSPSRRRVRRARAVRRVNRRVVARSGDRLGGIRTTARGIGRSSGRAETCAQPNSCSSRAHGAVPRAALRGRRGYGACGESWREFCEVVVAASGKTCAVVCGHLRGRLCYTDAAD